MGNMGTKHVKEKYFFIMLIIDQFHTSVVDLKDPENPCRNKNRGLFDAMKAERNAVALPARI